MTEKGYLRRLRWYIGLNLPQKTVKLTMNRYAAYFAKGKQSGKSEKLLVAECGSPRLAAAELVSAEQPGNFPFAGRRLLLTAALWLLLLVVYNMSTLPPLWALPLMLLAGLAATFFILGGVRIPGGKEIARKVSGLFAVNTLLLAAFGWVIQFGFVEVLVHTQDMATVQSQWLFRLLRITELHQVGPWMDGLLKGLGLLTLILMLFSALLAMRHSRLYVSLVCLNAGMLMGVALYLRIIRGLTDVASFYPQMIWVFVWAGTGLGTGLLILLVGRRLWKRS